MKKAEIIYDAITNVRESLIEEALDHRFRKKIPWQRYAALAACLVLFISVMPLMIAIVSPKGGADSAANSTAAAPQSPEAVQDKNHGAPGAAEPGAAPSTSGAAMESSPAETAPAEPAPAPAEPAETAAFTAEVLDVSDGRLWVRPLTGLAFTDPLEVDITGVTALPELQPGDRVCITFDGIVQPAEPARIAAAEVTKILTAVAAP